MGIKPDREGLLRAVCAANLPSRRFQIYVGGSKYESVLRACLHSLLNSTEGVPSYITLTCDVVEMVKLMGAGAARHQSVEPDQGLDWEGHP